MATKNGTRWMHGLFLSALATLPLVTSSTCVQVHIELSRQYEAKHLKPRYWGSEALRLRGGEELVSRICG